MRKKRSRQYTLCGENFNNVSEVREKCKQMYINYEDNEKLSKEDDEFIHEIFKNHY